MSMNAEDIGGIAITVVVSDAEALTALTNLETKILAVGRAAQGLRSIRIGSAGGAATAATGGAAAGATGGGSVTGPAGELERLQLRFYRMAATNPSALFGRAPTQAQLRQQTALTFGGAATGGAQGKEYTALQKAIDEALAKETGQPVEAVRQSRGGRTAQAGPPAEVAFTNEQAASIEKLTAALGVLSGAVTDLGARMAQGMPSAAAGATQTGAGAQNASRRRIRQNMAAQGVAEPEEGETANQGGPLAMQTAYQRRQAQLRREAEARNPANALLIDRSEQALNRQREREMSRKSLGRLEQRQAAGRMAGLSAGAQKERAEAEATGGVPGYASLAGPATDEQRREQEQRQRAYEQNQRFFARGRTRQPAAPDTGPDEEELNRRRQQRAAAAALQSERARNEAALRASTGGRTQGEDERERRVEAATARLRTSITAGGQTQRTLVSGLGALFGGTRGAGIEARTREADAARELNSAERAAEPLLRRRSELEDDIAHSTGAAQEASRKALGELNTQMTPAVERLTKAQKAYQTSLADVQKLQGLPSIAQNLIAISAAGAAFGVGLKAVDFALAAATPALQAWMDQMTGFSSTSTRVTTGLAQQTQAMHGYVTVALATQEAQAGLGTTAADYLNSQLQLTTQVKAGGLALQQQSDLFRAAGGLGGGAPQGLYGGYGGVLGSAFLAQQMGGGKGVGETIAGNLGAFSAQAALPSTAGSQAAAAAQQKALGAGLSPDFAKAYANFGALANAGLEGTAQPNQQQKAAAAQAQTALTQYVASLNQNIKTGAQALGALPESVAKFVKINDTQAAAIQASNLDSTFKDDAAAGFGLVDSQGRLILSTDAATKALEQLATGAAIPDMNTLARTMMPQVLAQAFMERQQLGLQLQGTRAAGIGQGQVGTINQQFGAQLSTTPSMLGNQTQALRALGATGLGQVAAQYRAIQVQANLAAQASADFVREQLPDMPQYAQQYADALKSAQGYATQIANIQIGVDTEQAALAAAQYSYNLYVAKRSLQDAKGLTGAITAQNGDNLGIIERQSFLISRQGQALGFQLTQRQINFSVAQAAFNVAGLSPAERQARIAEAKVEADYAQKQLDIQKQLYGLAGQQFNISASRQVTDLTRQLGLLQQGWTVTVDTAKAQKQIAALTVYQQAQQKVVDAIYSTALQRTQDTFGLEMTLLTQTADGMARIASGATTVVGNYYKAIIADLGILNAMYANPTATPTGAMSQRGHAQGALFSTSSPTSMVVGEAGTETVAVLRNPRNVTGTSTGGGGTFTFNFTGPMNVRSNDDIDVLATTVARKVATIMGRDAQLRGLRPIGVS
jgi:hypothetical protein